MKSEFETIFARLRTILERNAGSLAVTRNSESYSLLGKTGPAALKAWGGKMKKPMIPVAWVQIDKSYVSYHLMGLYGNAKLLAVISTELRSRMQGKTCFNFKKHDETLFAELDRITALSFASFKKAGFISDGEFAD